jgi:hypothetical protein
LLWLEKAFGKMPAVKCRPIESNDLVHRQQKMDLGEAGKPIIILHSESISSSLQLKILI